MNLDAAEAEDSEKGVQSLALLLLIEENNYSLVERL